MPVGGVGVGVGGSLAAWECLIVRLLVCVCVWVGVWEIVGEYVCECVFVWVCMHMCVCVYMLRFINTFQQMWAHWKWEAKCPFKYEVQIKDNVKIETVCEKIVRETKC